MLTLYRRHTEECPFYGRPRHAKGARACKAACTIWVQGSLGGQYVRQSLNLTAWEAASDLVRGWESSGVVGVVRPDIPSIPEAVAQFFADAHARKLAASTIAKQRNILERRLIPWCESQGFRLLRSLDIVAVRRFRATWPDAAITASRNLERLRNFFRFCRDARWIDSNPAEAVRAPRVVQSPTLPFEPKDYEKLLAACDQFSSKGVHREGNRARLRAMLMLLRHSGLRIRDAATLERAHIKNGKLFLYTQKTGTPVWLPLPPDVLDALDAVPSINEKYFFWSGKGDPKTTVADWQRSFRRLLELTDVKGHFHMLRDTAAVGWLTSGVPLETVSILLGHSSVRITEKHYSPWVKQRQELLEAAVRKAWQ